MYSSTILIMLVMLNLGVCEPEEECEGEPPGKKPKFIAGSRIS
jgi:hypothetical protein